MNTNIHYMWRMFKKQKRIIQGELWINAEDLVLPEGNTFYDALNAMLHAMDFDEAARTLCMPYYKLCGPGQPGTDPAVYFRTFLIGFFEGISSERQIERRCADSIMLHRFLGYSLTERVPDHTSIGLFRRKIPEEVFVQVFGMVLPALERMGLFSGKHLGLDTSVIDANASMRSLKNRITGEKYRDYVKRLAKKAGIDPDDEAAVSRFDRTRKGRKTSNKEWENPFDPDAKIGPTKHGATRMIYKPEHLVDMETGAILDATVLPGDIADGTDVADRMMEAEWRAAEALDNGEMDLPIESLTADKGYHSLENLERLSEYDIIPNIPDPCRNRNVGKLESASRQIIEWSRATVASVVGKELQRARGMYIERSFAHLLDAGGMRRTTLRGRTNIQKRYCIAALGYDIALMMVTLFGAGMPKQWAAMGLDALYSGMIRVFHAVKDRLYNIGRFLSVSCRWKPRLSPIMIGAIFALWRVKW